MPGVEAGPRRQDSDGKKATVLAMRETTLLATLAAALLTGMTCGAWAQDAAPPDWPAVKCERYRKVWTDVMARRGNAGLGTAFLERHEAFIASGCTSRADVCPRTPQELQVANLLSLGAMNAGMTGSFLPFACRD